MEEQSAGENIGEEEVVVFDEDERIYRHRYRKVGRFGGGGLRIFLPITGSFEEKKIEIVFSESWERME